MQPGVTFFDLTSSPLVRSSPGEGVTLTTKLASSLSRSVFGLVLGQTTNSSETGHSPYKVPSQTSHG